MRQGMLDSAVFLHRKGWQTCCHGSKLGSRAGLLELRCMAEDATGVCLRLAFASEWGMVLARVILKALCAVVVVIQAAQLLFSKLDIQNPIFMAARHTVLIPE